MHITDILDIDDLAAEIGNGYVTERYHPEFSDLMILNYTDKCQFDDHWNRVTLNTRGLIVDTSTGTVIARGLSKFFNYGDESHTGQLNPDMPILSAHDKIDGSLGIGYVRPDGRPAIATRGSFTSEQAIHATERMTAAQGAEILRAHQSGTTPLWEIVYPANRIVLDYGDRDELVYIGLVNNQSGRFTPAPTSDDDMQGGTLRDVLNRAPRPNAEGYVIWLNESTAIKLKQEDYIALHRIVSRLSVKEVWRQLRDGTFDEFAASLPDEFHAWAKAAGGDLVAEFESISAYAHELLDELTGQGFTSRKDQALWVAGNVPSNYRGFVFSLLDEKDIAPGIWRLVEPKGNSPYSAEETEIAA